MTIGIIGMGYVGLPLAVAFAEEGRHVIALDTDVRKVEALRAGESYVEDIPNERLAAVSDRIEPTTHKQPLARCDAVLICVPTPLTANREPDLGPLISATTASGSRRSSRSPASSPAATSTSRSRPSASTRGARTSRCARPRRSSAASRRRAATAPSRSTRRSATRSSGSRRPRRPSWRSCSRTSSAR